MQTFGLRKFMEDINADEHLDATGEITIETVKKRAVGGIAALTGRTIFFQGVTLIATFFLTVFLNPGQYGVFYIVSAVVGFFAKFDMGLAAALVQKKDHPAPQDLKTAFTIQNSIVLTFVILIFLTTPFISSWQHLNQESTYLLWALALGLLIASLKSIPSTLLERELNFSRYVIPQMVEQLLFYTVAVFLAWRGLGVTSYTVAVLVSGVSGLILIYILRPWKPGIAWDGKSFRNLLRYGIPYQFNTILASIKDDGMTLVLGGILGSANYGLLVWAKKWAEAPLRFFMDQVIKVTFPAYSRMQDNQEELSKAVTKSLLFICLLVFPALAGLVILAPSLVNLIPRYGKWEPALFALALISINSAWAAITTPLTNVLMAIGKIKTTSRLMVMWTVLTWVLFPLLAYLYGINGVAWGYVVVGCSSLVAVLVALKSVKVDILSCIGKPLFSTLIFALALLAGRQLLPLSWISFFSILMFGLLIYLFFTFLLLGPTLSKDAKKLALGIRGRI